MAGQQSDTQEEPLDEVSPIPAGTLEEVTVQQNTMSFDEMILDDSASFATPPLSYHTNESISSLLTTDTDLRYDTTVSARIQDADLDTPPNMDGPPRVRIKYSRPTGYKLFAAQYFNKAEYTYVEQEHLM